MNPTQKNFDRVANLKFLQHRAVVKSRHMCSQSHRENGVDQLTWINLVGKLTLIDAGLNDPDDGAKTSRFQPI